MRRKHSAIPKKRTFVIGFLLILVITGVLLMSRDIAPAQTPVEEELDASAFTANK